VALICDCEGETELDVPVEDAVVEDVVDEDDVEEPAPEVVDATLDDVEVVPDEDPVVVDPAAPATADCQPKPRMLTAHSRNTVAGRDARRRRILRWTCPGRGWRAAALPARSSATRSRLVLSPRFEKGSLLVNMVFM
jgi:hypothetical protein